MTHTVTRYHDFCAGHRVAGHENKCASLHGHNYRIHFNVQQTDPNGLDRLGRVVDFSVVKRLLCEWLEDNWDHRFLVWVNDPLREHLIELPGVITVPFNPTAENMGHHLVNVVGPKQLAGTGLRLVSVVVEETRKCSALVCYR